MAVPGKRVQLSSSSHDAIMVKYFATDLNPPGLNAA